MNSPNPPEVHGIAKNLPTYLVFAGSFREFKDWALGNDIGHGDALFVSNPTTLTQLKDTDLHTYRLVMVGTFHLRSDSREIIKTAQERFPGKTFENGLEE